jgi:hypothetical protein
VDVGESNPETAPVVLFREFVREVRQRLGWNLFHVVREFDRRVVVVRVFVAHDYPDVVVGEPFEVECLVTVRHVVPATAGRIAVCHS